MNSKMRIYPDPVELEVLQSIYGASRETLELFQIYADLLVEWQAKTNLVSNSTLNQLWTRHICDSAQCKLIIPDKVNWIDLGSGAGFPGLVISILSRNEPEFSMTLVESNQKKCAFLRKVVRETGISVNILPQRIESVTKQIVLPEVISARALSSLDQLLTWTYDWISQGAIGIFPKGKDYTQELEKCHGRWNFDLLVHKSRVSEDSVILEIQNLKRA